MKRAFITISPLLPAVTLTLGLLASGASAQSAAAQTTATQGAATQSTGAPCAGQVVRDATGPVCVPKNPTRIVTIEWTYSEDLLALGIQPVGMADIKGFTAYVHAPMPIAAGVKDVGQRGQASLEAIAALKPDLIINEAGDYSQQSALSRIAPTLVFNPYADRGESAYAKMRQTFLTLGRVTGRTEQAQAVLARLDADLAAARTTLARRGRAGQTFVLSQGYDLSNPTLRLFGQRSMGSEVIERMGLRNAYRSSTPDYGFGTFSLEGLLKLNTQNFFGIAQGDDNVYTAPASQPLWRRLPFVQQGHGYTLAPDTWLFGGPESARYLTAQVLGAMK